MYIITEITTNKSYYSRCLGALSYIPGVTRQTLYNWLKQPEKAVKQGFILAIGQQVKTKRQGRR